MDLIRRIRAFLDILPEPDLSPGPWFRDYCTYFATVHDIPLDYVDACLTSGIVQGKYGWVWVTNSPELDRFFFESRGFRFPSRWVTWESIQGASGEAGSLLTLDI